MATPKSTGQCGMCGKSFSKSGMSRHLQSCREKEKMNQDPVSRPGGISEKGFHLAVEGRHSPEYWLHLDVSADAPLAVLDRYLRHTWLECCGHLSAFYINGRERSSRSRHKLARILSPGMQFTHEYDFGDTTELTLRVVWEGDVNAGVAGIRLLARNDPPALACNGCGSASTEICTECIWRGEGLLCDGCAVQHPCDDEMFLPVVNSPRVGQCGYTGD